MVEVKAALRRAELEPWDRGWSRLYETVPAARLDDEVVREAGGIVWRDGSTQAVLCSAKKLSSGSASSGLNRGSNRKRVPQ